MLEALAQYDGTLFEPAIRVHRDGNCVRIDLGDETWRYVEITGAGWQVKDGAATFFHRSASMRSLPEPVRNGRLTDLRKHLNATDDHNWLLMASWLVAAARGRGPYPALVIQGEQGSAKTTTCKLICRVLDPGKAELRKPPRKTDALAIAAMNSHILAFDNLSHLSADLSDDFCRLTTGGGLSARELYSDDEEVVFEFCRPLILNGISEIVTRSDLLDRAYVVALPHFGPEGMRSHDDVVAAFKSDLPSILGGLCDAVACALRNLSKTPVPIGARMQDAARFAEASAPVWTECGKPLEAILRARSDANSATIESSPVALAIKQLATPWRGTATELLAAISHAPTDEIERRRRDRSWPKDASALSRHLDRLAPVLRAEGIEVSKTRSSTIARTRLWLIDKVGKMPSIPSMPSNTSKTDYDSNNLPLDGVLDGIVSHHEMPSNCRPTLTTQNRYPLDGRTGLDGKKHTLSTDSTDASGDGTGTGQLFGDLPGQVETINPRAKGVQSWEDERVIAEIRSADEVLLLCQRYQIRLDIDGEGNVTSASDWLRPYLGQYREALIERMTEWPLALEKEPSMETTT
jgi:hypothetical protein